MPPCTDKAQTNELHINISTLEPSRFSDYSLLLLKLPKGIIFLQLEWAASCHRKYLKFC